MRERVDNRHIGTGLQRQVIRGFDVWRANQVDAPRIDDDQFRALADCLLHLRSEHRVTIGRVGADQQDDIGFLHAVEGLRACRRAQRLFQAIAGWRMTDAGAGIDVVIVKAGADQLLHDIHFLDRTTRRGDAADRFAAVLLLQCLESCRRIFDGFFP